tara:strand:+ start:131 stop:580 length:450 start_codon:yes stop_codon:yes gene_type:complete
MKIRLALIEDSEHIWKWRNDPDTRTMSMNSDKVSWEDHSTWYSNAISSELKVIYVGIDEVTNDLVGMVRFDIEDNRLKAKSSINLNPNWRGKRISIALLKISHQYFRRQHKMPIIAMIKKANQASIKCFEGCGYRFRSEDNNCMYYEFY